nr:hydrogenase expression/formation protein HypE [Desulfurispira natronophila]
MPEHIRLSHGGGGQETQTLIREVFYRSFGNDILLQAEDSALFHLNNSAHIAMTTDSYTVSPRFFPGGNIGKIAVCGTCNDLAMVGAKPCYLSCGFIIEEGFAIAELRQIATSMASELSTNGCQLVTGDTKVVPRGGVDGIYINTTAVGECCFTPPPSSSSLKPGQVLLVSGNIGSHGAVIFCHREGIDVDSGMQSDCRSLWPVVHALLPFQREIVAMRDATRGGIAAVLHEWADQSETGIQIEASSVPVQNEVQGFCEMMGFEPWHLANEGTFVLAVEAQAAQAVLDILRKHRSSAAIIGQVIAEHPQRVILQTPWGTRSFMEPPTGELLPRIC